MFWAVEVEGASYLRIGQKEDPFSIPAGTSTEWMSPTFWHNPLHDCESIWWMLLYGFALRMVKDADTEKWDKETQREELDKVFPSGYRLTTRRDILFMGGYFSKFFSSLESRLRQASSNLDQMRTALLATLDKAEEKMPDGEIDRATWTYNGPLHKRMVALVRLLKTVTWPAVVEWSSENVKEEVSDQTSSEMEE
jgi:hypothetical protein